MSPTLRAGIISLLAVLVFACGGKPETLPQAVIDSASDKQTLRELYKQLEIKTEEKDPEKDKALFDQLDEVGGKLAGLVEDEVHQTIERGKLPSGIVPLSVLDQARREATPIKQWSQERFDAMVEEVSALEEDTQEVVSQERDKLTNLGSKPSAERLRTLERLGEVTGDSTWNSQYDSELAALEEMFDQARAEDSLDKAKEIGAILETISPEKQGLVEQLVEVDTRLFEKRFYQALESDAPNAPDVAYKEFETLAASRHFPEIRKSLAETGKTMAAYFVALAKGATQSGQLGNAYQRFSQARTVKSKLGLGPMSVPEEQEFLNRIIAGLEKLDTSEYPGIALGYLYIIQEMNPQYPQLKKMIRENEEAVLKRATKRVSTTAFKNASGKHEYGNTIAAKVTQHLFREVPNDIRIVERDDYEAIVREQELSGEASLLTVDYLITGSVLESKVDTSEKSFTQQKQVVIEKGKKETQEYLAWLQLSEREQKKRGMPQQYEEYEKKKLIDINGTSVRKVGIFSINYRLIEADTGKVLLPGNVKLDKEYTDESNDGIEIGEFILPREDIDLPSDIEILDELATEISEKAGRALVNRLKDSEKRYAADARKYLEENNYTDATANMADALAIARQKSMDIMEYKKLLKMYSAYSPFAS